MNMYTATTKKRMMKEICDLLQDLKNKTVNDQKRNNYSN